MATNFRGFLDAIKSLQDKLHPLETRLAAIEANKGSTPESVYSRVRSETIDQIEALRAEQTSRRSEGEELLQKLTTERSQIAAELSRVTEQVEEIRFRHKLGEFGDEDFAAKEEPLVAEAAPLETQLAPLDEALAALEPFVASTSSPAASSPAPVAEAPPAAPVVPTEPVPVNENTNEMPLAASAIAEQEAPQENQEQATSPPLPSAVDSEMEALFGSTSPSSLPAPQPPGQSGPTLSKPFPSEHDEDTTEEIPFQRKPKTDFPQTGGGFRPVLIIKAKDRDRGEDTYELASGQTLIGRAPENDIILLEESVSRRHARLIVENDECSLEDMGSANGSYANGERLKPRQPKKLNDNDVLKIGQLLALYRENPND